MADTLDVPTTPGTGPPAAPAHRRTHRRTPATRRVPVAVWALTGLWCALMLGASVVWPMSYGADEPQHIDMAYDYAAHPFSFYGPGQLALSKANVGLQRIVPGYPPQTRFAQQPIPPRSHRPSFDQLGGHALSRGGQPNQMDQHPPLYYWVEAVALSVPGVSGLAWDVQVWLMRLVSILIMAPIPLLCWSATRRLLGTVAAHLPAPQAARLAVVAAAVPVTIPNLVRDGASVDNDTLLFLSVSVVMWGLVRVITGDRRLRTAVTIAVALAVGLWTKGFALALPPVILIAYLLAPREGRSWGEHLAMSWRPLAVCAAGGVAGAFWWIRNVIDYHTVQTNGFGEAYSVQHIYGPRDYKGTLFHFVPTFVEDFAARIWGQIGLPDPPSAGPLIIYGWLFVAVIGVTAALAVKGAPGTRRRLAALALLPVAFFAITFQGSYSAFHQWAHDGVRSASGRYLYGAIVIVAALFAVGWLQILRPRFHRRLALLVAVGAVLTNAAAWLLIVRSWYAPVADTGLVSGTRHGMGALLRWAPLPAPATLLFVLIVPAAAAIVCIGALWNDMRRWGPAPGDDETGLHAGGVEDNAANPGPDPKRS